MHISRLEASGSPKSKGFHDAFGMPVRLPDGA